MIRTSLLAIATVLGAGAELHAQSAVNIDFGPGFSGVYEGVGAAPDSGIIWNGIDDPTADAGTAGVLTILDSMGMETAVTIATTSSGGQSGNIGPQELGPGEAGAELYRPLMDYLFIFGGNKRTLTIGGLTAGGEYDLYLYGQGDQLTQFSGFTINQVTKITSYDQSQVPPIDDDVLTEGIEYVLFSDIVASQTGEIQVIHDNGGESFGGFNGLQILGTFAAPQVPLELLINTSTGNATIQNNNALPVTIDSYVIQTDQNSLNPADAPTGWDSLDDQGIDETAGAPAGDFNGNGTVDLADYTVWRDANGPLSDYELWKQNFGATGGDPTGWDEAAGVSSNLLAEFFLGSNEKLGSTLAAGTAFDLGSAYSSGTEDGNLTFTYHDAISDEMVVGTVTFVSSGNISTSANVPEPGGMLLGFVALAGCGGLRTLRRLRRL